MLINNKKINSSRTGLSIIFLLFFTLSSCKELGIRNRHLGAEDSFRADYMLWSFQGDGLVFSELSTEFDDAGSQVYIYDFQEEELTLLVESESNLNNLIIQFFSLDGQYLYFSSDGDDLYRKGIWGVDLTNSSAPFYSWNSDVAEISPFGDIALFNINIWDHITEIAILSGETNQIIASFSVPGVIQGPADWSNDGTHLIFEIYENEVDNIFLVVLDVADGEVNEIKDENFLYSPQWSPLGPFFSYLKFDSLNILNINGHCNIEILSEGIEVFATAWSPDGLQIAYITEKGINYLDIEEMFGEAIFSGDFPCNENN